MAFKSINGIAIHYRDEGPRDAPVIVFSNSLGTDFRIWDGLIAVLNERGLNARFIRYDKRGHGLSDAPAQPYRMDDHVSDLASLLDELNVANAVIFGLSVGGLIAQGIYAKRPDLVRAIVLSNTAHKIGNDEMWNGRIADVNSGGIQSVADVILERWFSPEYRGGDNADFAGYSNMLIRTTVDGYCGTSAAIQNCDYTNEAAAISVPTLLIGGSNDGSTPPDLMRSTHQLIPGSILHIIDGPGHLPCIECPDKTADVFLDFYRDI